MCCCLSVLDLSLCCRFLASKCSCSPPLHPFFFYFSCVNIAFQKSMVGCMKIDYCTTLQQKLWHRFRQTGWGEGKCCDTDLSLCLFGSFPPYLTHAALTNTASVLTGEFTNNHSFITWSCCKTPYGLLNLTVVHLSRDFEEKTLQNDHKFSLTLWKLRGRSCVKEDTVVKYMCACVHACTHAHAYI